MFKLVLEKPEEPEIKLPTSTGSWKKEASSRKNIYFCFIDYAKAFDCVDHKKLWEILKEMGIPGFCLLRNLYAGQKATIRTGHGTTDWFQIGKGVHPTHPSFLFIVMLELNELCVPFPWATCLNVLLFSRGLWKTLKQQWKERTFLLESTSSFSLS